jgi:hypothetical protein
MDECWRWVVLDILLSNTHEGEDIFTSDGSDAFLVIMYCRIYYHVEYSII